MNILILSPLWYADLEILTDQFSCAKATKHRYSGRSTGTVNVNVAIESPISVRRCDSLVVNLPWIERGERNLVAPACGTRQEERNLNLVAPACGAGQEERNLKAMS